MTKPDKTALKAAETIREYCKSKPITCEDAISREDALMVLTGEIKETDTIETIIARSGRRIKSLPSVNPQEPKTGHWIFDDECKEHAHCSCCRYGSVDLVDGEPHNYCRKCGARLTIEPQESEGINADSN